MISRSRNSSTPAGQVLANGRRRQGRGEGRSLFGSGRTSIRSFALRVASRCAALGRTIQEHPDRELQPLHDIEWPQDLSTPRIEQHQPRSGSEGCLGPAGFTSNLHLQRAFMELLHVAGARKKWAAPVADGASAGHLMGTCCCEMISGTPSLTSTTASTMLRTSLSWTAVASRPAHLPS